MLTQSNIEFKLWVLKFCIKLIYPRYNYLMFMVFIGIKYRIISRKKIRWDPDYNMLKLRSNSTHVQRLCLNEFRRDNLSTLWHKCLIIPREQFLDLACENLFYHDNGVMWITMKLTPQTKKFAKLKLNENNNHKFFKYNLNILTSEIHKEILKDKSSLLERVKIVPVIGSRNIPDKTCSVTEVEYHNIVSSYGVTDVEQVEISFHPITNMDYAPKIASSAEVSHIVNDYDLDNDFLKEILSNHFEKPKLVHVNDLFYINLLPTITSKYHYKYLDLIENVGRLYFKCQKLEYSDKANISNTIVEVPCFIVKGVTQLTLGENIHILKPEDKFFHSETIRSKSNISACPTGFKDKMNVIQETIQPFLSGRISELLSSLPSPVIPMLLVTGPEGSGTHLLVKTLARSNGLNYLQIDCNALQSSTAKQTESKITATIQKAKAASPVIVVLDNFEVFAVDAENDEDCRIIEYFVNSLTELYQNYTKHTIIFTAITERTELKPNILRIFLDKFHIPKLNAQQRYEMLEWFASVMEIDIDDVELSQLDVKPTGEVLTSYAKDVLNRVAAKTETFSYGDLDTLVHFALRESYLKQHKNDNNILELHMNNVQEDDFSNALESMRSLQSHHLDAPKIPKVYWEDIGGLDKLKKELLKTIEFPIKYPHLFKNSTLKRSGILLYGPPGCGKTLVAKAVSTELNVSFLSVKGPELLNMYIGQSEENVRKVFESARASSPCIVFLDELDALAPRRGAAGDSGGASDRLVSQLLAELDGVTTADDADTSSFVFIMGATNRPDLLEQSLLRPGRLDKLIYVGPYSGVKEKTSVLTALCRSHVMSSDVDLEAVSASLPLECTGADLLAVVSGARAAATRNTVRELHTGAIKESELGPDSVLIGASEMWEGVKSFRPSVTPEELAYYTSLQNTM